MISHAAAAAAVDEIAEKVFNSFCLAKIVSRNKTDNCTEKLSQKYLTKLKCGR